VSIVQKIAQLRKSQEVETSYEVKQRIKQNAGTVEPFVQKQAGNPQINEWAKQEDDTLIDLWNKGYKVGKIYAYFLSKSMNRSRKAITSEISRLQENGIIDKRQGAWTQKEDALLIRLWNTDLGAPQISKYFNRTESSIEHRIADLIDADKIKRRKDNKSITSAVEIELDEELQSRELTLYADGGFELRLAKVDVKIKWEKYKEIIDKFLNNS
jgi:predicted transcriptional regulator